MQRERLALHRERQRAENPVIFLRSRRGDHLDDGRRGIGLEYRRHLECRVDRIGTQSGSTTDLRFAGTGSFVR